MSDALNPSNQRWLVQVCQHRTCQRHHAQDILAAFRTHQSEHIRVTASGCMGQCSSGPTVRILPDNTWYCRVQSQDVDLIVDQHLKGGEPVKPRLHPRFHPNPQEAP